VSFPMMFLSGTFFPRDGFPGWLAQITDYFPLTYLADALRRITNEGATLVQLSGDLLGLTVWGIVMFAVAVKVFSWE
jgi:ABC-2 type transport system permease protein